MRRSLLPLARLQPNCSQSQNWTPVDVHTRWWTTHGGRRWTPVDSGALARTLITGSFLDSGGISFSRPSKPGRCHGRVSLDAESSQNRRIREVRRTASGADGLASATHHRHEYRTHVRWFPRSGGCPDHTWPRDAPRWPVSRPVARLGSLPAAQRNAGRQAPRKKNAGHVAPRGRSVVSAVVRRT